MNKIFNLKNFIHEESEINSLFSIITGNNRTLLLLEEIGETFNSFEELKSKVEDSTKLNLEQKTKLLNYFSNFFKNQKEETPKTTYIFPKKINNVKTEENNNIKTERNQTSLKLFLEENTIFQNNNIYFKIGQPNTSKSYSFERKQLFKNEKFNNENSYKYFKIMVEGGENNLKGLNSEDISISYNVVTEKPYFTEFLQIIMSSIINPEIPHILFLDDFHNIDISSLLSPYTGMLKNFNEIENTKSLDEFFNIDNQNKEIQTIEEWNTLIKKIAEDNKIEISTILNKMTGENIELFAPKNLFILGAANWNYNSINIFDDIRERAKIEYIDIYSDEKELKDKDININKNNAYFKTLLNINKYLKEILEDNHIFDYEKYGIGIYRYFKNNLSEKEILEDNHILFQDMRQTFDLIRSSLRFNGKNSYINEYSYLLIKKLLNDKYNNKTFIDILFYEIDINNKSEIFKISEKDNIEELFKTDTLEELENDNKETYKQVCKILYILNLYNSN
jgi:hypothetical protein